MADRTILPVGQPRQTLPVPPPVRPQAVAANGPFLQNAYAKYGKPQVDSFLSAVAHRPAPPSPLAALAAPAATDVNYQSSALSNPAFAPARQHILDVSNASGNDINAAQNTALGNMLTGLAQQNTYHQQAANTLKADAQSRLQAYRTAIGGLAHDADLARFGGTGAVNAQSMADQRGFTNESNRVGAYENALNQNFGNVARDRMGAVQQVTAADQQQRLVNEFKAMQSLDQQAQQAIAAASRGGGGGRGGRRSGGSGGSSGSGSGSDLAGGTEPNYNMLGDIELNSWLTKNVDVANNPYYKMAAAALANGADPSSVYNAMKGAADKNRAGASKASGFGSLKDIGNFITQMSKDRKSKLSALVGKYT